MYQITKNKRKYSPDPIVKINNDKEIIVFISLLPKKEGDKLTKIILNLLNNNN
jgi:hypothetical protein